MDNTLDAIHHFALTVAEIAPAVHWYTSSFNCEVLLQEKTHAMLQFHNVRLSLVLPSQQPVHIAFERHDAATLGELRLRPDGCRSTFIADPAGNPVEIVAAGENR